MKTIAPPVVDVQPHDDFEVLLSQRTGAWLLYRYRQVRRTTAKASLLVATYGDRRTAMRHCQALRCAAQRLATSPEWDEHRGVWAGIEGGLA